MDGTDPQLPTARPAARGLLFARILGAVGRTLITAGVLILLFVAYQLWGTGIRTAQSQHRLEHQFQDDLDEADGAVVGSSSTSTATTAADTTSTSRLTATTAGTLPADLLPTDGQVAGHIEIPTIGADFYFVQGVTVSDLKQGPGHYPDTPFPGQAGNAAIAGHRTTYGAPFGNVDKLNPGDEIDITTVQGRFTYLVRQTVIVPPTAIQVLAPGHWDFDGDGVPDANTLTLTACHPKYSARQRIVIAAELVGQPAPTTVRPPEEATPVHHRANLSGKRATAGPAILWALVCAAVWLLSWAVGKRWRRLRWPAYLVGFLPFLVCLFFFFENFSRLLPANF